MKKNKILKNNNKILLFQKKYFERYISSLFLIIFSILYFFIGSISTEWLDKKNIKIANYFFIFINCIILCFINFEILKLNNINNNWPIFSKIITYFLIIFLYLFPSEKVSNYQGAYIPINFEFYVSLKLDWIKNWMILFFYLLIFLFYILLIFTSKKIKFSKIIFIYLFSIYVVFSFKSITKFMLNNFYGWNSVLWIFIIVIFTDVFAFIGGVSYGKHKLLPKISPNKTWEGAIIGFIFSVLFSFLYSFLIFNFLNNKISEGFYKTIFIFDFFSNDNKNNISRYIIYFILSVLLSFIAQLGDFLLSYIKRIYKIKNFSNLLPGHGGILDRIDSFLLVFFFMYIFSNIVLL